MIAVAVAAVAVGIGLTEWQVTVGREQVPAGKVRFNVTNVGEDGHDFAIRRAGEARAHLPELQPGEQATLRARLRRGRYVLFCDLPDHEEQGMKARLRVVRR